MLDVREKLHAMKAGWIFFLFTSLLTTQAFGAEEVEAQLPALELANFPSQEVAKSEELAKLFPSKMQPKADDGYTINYNTISILEYLRFASKICKVNFIYEETDLNFTVTVVSDEPITAQNVMATLLQVLRIHGLSLLEQGNSLVIHKSPEVRQMATLVTDAAEKGQQSNAPIITRIFRLKNAKPDSLAAIIRPMISTAAILETSPETHQLILTDTTASVDKVAALIENLDSPHSLFEIKSYVIQNNNPEFLIELGSQIMNPIAQGNPFILVPQPLANSIFIVSTPELADKAISVFTSLDTPPKKELTAERRLKSENIFVYKIVNSTGDQILKGLQNIADNLQKSGVPEADLIQTIDNARWIRENNSILFIGSKSSIEKAKEFLGALDVASGAPTAKSSFFIYKPQYRTAEDVEKAILEMAANIKGAKGTEENLVETIQSVKMNPLTHTLVFSGEEKTFPHVRELLATIDTQTAKSLRPAAKNSFYLYKIQQSPESEIASALKDFAKSLDQSNAAEDGLIEAIHNMKYIKENNTILFTGPEPALKRLQEIVPSFDKGIHPQMPVSSQFYIYKPRFQNGEQLENSIKDVESHLKTDKIADPALLRALESMKWVKSTQSLMFTGDPSSLKKVEELIGTLDIQTAAAPKPGSEKTFFLYQLQYAPQAKTEEYLRQVASNLNKTTDGSLIETIDSMKWIEPSHSLMFHGTENSIGRLKELLKNFDVQAQAKPAAGKKDFFLYRLQYAPQERVQKYLEQVADNLSKKGGDEDLVMTIRSMKWVEPSHSYMFQGTDASLARLKELLTAFDTQSQAKSAKGFFVYQPQHASQEKVEKYLGQLADNLSKKGGNEDLVQTIHSMKWIEVSHSFMFNGSDESIAQVKDLLKNFDTPQEESPSKPGYYIYKVQHTTGDVIEEDLDNLAKNFKSTGLKDTKIVSVIEKMRYVKETNSLLLTGDPKAIDEVKALIIEYDYPRTGAPKGPTNSSFFMYKPQHATAAQIEKSLRDVGSNLKKADLADPSLLSAIDSLKYVETTNSLIFTGTPDSLQKIQTLIKDIDIPPQKHAPIQHVGKTTFLLYKLQHADGNQITTSIKLIASDLKKSGSTDKDFMSALNSMKYVKETHSLLFTGTEDSLVKIQALVEKFDVTGLAAHKVEAPVTGPTDFLVYKPQSLAGPDLEKILSDFAENLKMSGLYDPELFNAITSMRWVDKTQSLIFTGTQKSLGQVKELLTTFDIPSNLPAGPTPGGPLEPSIQAIDNTSFLVYKLQFHKGDEIQGALRQIAKDLILSNAPVNQSLLNSINSIQWLEVTNSLLCSGDQETLTRLRELIKNLDIPLKQVFIEMLVVQTTLINALNFGLEWSGNYKYRNKFSTVMNNTAPSPNGTYNPDPLFNSLQNTLIPPTAPTPQMIPASGSGSFDLGVIGEVIRHGGETFLTLGSLLTALQTDNETTLIMTPKLLTQDGRTSTIFVGDNIPFVGSFVQNNGSSTVNTSNIEYRDIGFNLTITPVLGNSNIVTLDINLDRSQTTVDPTGSAINFNSLTAQGIITSKTTMQTTVHVPDKNFLILSGMVNNSSNKAKAGVPCLGGLPLIGAAFSKANETVSNSNIVIFLRPHIIDSLEDMRTVSSDQEEFFRDQAGTPYLEHNFEEAMELIKTVDDD